MFSFTVSSSTVSLAPNGTVRVTITQTSSDPQAVLYGVTSKYNGGWDAPSYLDQFGKVTYAFKPTPARITGNGSLTLNIAASSSVEAQSIVAMLFELRIRRSTKAVAG
jgi:hypothetical protein